MALTTLTIEEPFPGEPSVKPYREGNKLPKVRFIFSFYLTVVKFLLLID